MFESVLSCWLPAIHFGDPTCIDDKNIRVLGTQMAHGWQSDLDHLIAHVPAGARADGLN